METHFHQKNINFHELASVGSPGVPPEGPKHPGDCKKYKIQRKNEEINFYIRQKKPKNKRVSVLGTLAHNAFGAY